MICSFRVKQKPNRIPPLNSVNEPNGRQRIVAVDLRAALSITQSPGNEFVAPLLANDLRPIALAPIVLYRANAVDAIDSGGIFKMGG
jgi:hypothetical protein